MYFDEPLVLAFLLLVCAESLLLSSIHDNSAQARSLRKLLLCISVLIVAKQETSLHPLPWVFVILFSCKTPSSLGDWGGEGVGSEEQTGLNLVL